MLPCTGSLVALVCVVGVLLNYNGKPIHDWPHVITINAVLSWIYADLQRTHAGAAAACFGQIAWI
ncbi:hypothetical protein BDW71DRAFT_181969 [Aspergillus fruticulosus]